MSDDQVAVAAEATTPSGSEDWRSALPPEISADPSLQHWQCRSDGEVIHQRAEDGRG